MRSWIEIDLAAIKYNCSQIKKAVGRTVSVIGVVKADAYGLGISAVARALDEAGVEMFAVISLEEALKVQQVSSKPVLIMGYLEGREISEAIRNGFILSLYDRLLASRIEKEAVLLNSTARLHLKVETGMNRLGVSQEEAVDLLLLQRHYPHLRIEAIYSHLAKATDPQSNYAQINRLRELVMEIQDKIKLLPIHLVSSYALSHCQEGYFDAVRVGLAFYGTDNFHLDLKSVIAVKAKIMQIKTIEKGEGVSYDHLFVASKTTKIAIAAIGYSEGLSQAFDNRMAVLIEGKRKPVLGKICMNHIIIEADDTNIKVGDEAVIIGSQKDLTGNISSLSVEDLASCSNLRHHEIVTRLGSSLPRKYLEG